jgi:Immunity protein Imm1
MKKLTHFEYLPREGWPSPKEMEHYLLSASGSSHAFDTTERQMRKYVYFDDFKGSGWPSPSEIEHYFLSFSGRREAFDTDNDCWGLFAGGADGIEPAGEGGIDLYLTMVGNPSHGVLLQCFKARGECSNVHYSRGNLERLREWVRTRHGYLMPVGLFIPFEQAWSAVKEFIETDGALPQSIAWIADHDIPPDAFPDPAERPAWK